MKNNIPSRLKALNKSRFRAKFKLEEKDQNYIVDRGLAVVKSHAYDFVRSRLAPAVLKNDGKQTPFEGHPVFKAQHATATCCRGCLKKWHRIEKAKAMSSEEIEYTVSVIMAWLDSKLIPAAAVS